MSIKSILENIKKQKDISSNSIIETIEELKLVDEYIINNKKDITDLSKKLYKIFKYPISGELKLLELKMYESIDFNQSQQDIDSLVWNYYESQLWDILPNIFWTDKDSIFRNLKYIDIIKEYIQILILSKGKYYKNVCLGLLGQIEELILAIYILKRGDIVNKISDLSIIRVPIEEVIDYLEKEYNNVDEDSNFKNIIFTHLYAKSYIHIYNKDILINRHKIFHGQGYEYLTKANVIRLFLITRYLIWIYYDVHQNIIDNIE